MHVPAQTCCGQPAYNSGDRGTTRDLAEQVIDCVFWPVLIYVGCTVRILCRDDPPRIYPELFHDDPNWLPRANALAAKTYELTSFLVDVDVLHPHRRELPPTRDLFTIPAPACVSSVWQNQPRKLLAGVEGLELVEMPESDVCCGFGGTFAVKYGEISNAIVEKKAENISGSGAPVLLAGDLGCLMNMAGKLSREGKNDRSASCRRGARRA